MHFGFKIGSIKFLLKYKNEIITSRTTSFVNDSHGVSLIASPKQPQSVTLLKYAEYHVRKVKKIIINSKLHIVRFFLYPKIKNTPSTTSTITINIAIGKTVGIKKSISKTHLKKTWFLTSILEPKRLPKSSPRG